MFPPLPSHSHPLISFLNVDDADDIKVSHDSDVREMMQQGLEERYGGRATILALRVVNPLPSRNVHLRDIDAAIVHQWAIAAARLEAGGRAHLRVRVVLNRKRSVSDEGCVEHVTVKRAALQSGAAPALHGPTAEVPS